MLPKVFLIILNLHIYKCSEKKKHPKSDRGIRSRSKSFKVKIGYSLDNTQTIYKS